MEEIIQTKTSSTINGNDGLAQAERNAASSSLYRRSDSFRKYGSSWAEDIQKYKAAKGVLPWKPHEQEPVKHVTRYQKSREEREYDWVLGKFRDPARETDLQERERNRVKQNLEHGRAKQLRTVQRFHLINHRPLYEGATDHHDKIPKPHPYRSLGAAPYHIITNVPHTQENEQSVPTKTFKSKQPQRDFNILSNKYHREHDDRTDAEYRKAKEVAAVKFCKVNNYDPIRAEYYDKDKEIDFLAKRAQEQLVHGKDRVLILPPTEQMCGGRVYNILSNEMVNPEKLLAATEKDRRALNKIKKTAFEQRMLAEGETKQDQDDSRCLNRTAHARNAQAYVHGYDPITNQSFSGRNAKPKMPLRTSDPQPTWKRIEQSSSIQGAVQADKRLFSPIKATPTSRGLVMRETESNTSVTDESRTKVDRSSITLSSVRTSGFNKD